MVPKKEEKMIAHDGCWRKDARKLSRMHILLSVPLSSLTFQPFGAHDYLALKLQEKSYRLEKIFWAK